MSSAGAPIGQDPEVAQVISDYHAELHDALSRGIRAWAPELDAEQSDRLADTATGLVIAAFALARVDLAQANRSIETARELIETA
ncbi:hypothetical protein MUN76_05905 [Leucobacter rhizosphaerae]|uniref:ANTAR domain-containing protein n=1 Tax=Leucobacter rhizosphaerae TaxID=2932245 RepID=A0ABY4FZ41_9MICO|nr:hypothetical protein [Leucobacter rhizosphaerae]UOQ61501.1 hypothetical protein MUN76_05905 [Leucobacter rhizosphaerae]